LKQKNIFFVFLALLIFAGAIFVLTNNQNQKENYANDSVVAGENGQNMMDIDVSSYYKSKTIAEVASEDSDFSTLFNLLIQANLDGVLSGDGPFTVFAPTNSAFMRVPQDTLESFLVDPERLAEILKYHVVPGKVTSAELSNLKSIKTVQGLEIIVEVNDPEIMVNNAKVLNANIEAKNGLIHVIDTVLIPQ